MSKRQPSRPQRWAAACEAASAALEALNAAREELADIKSEYEDWKENLPESFQDTPLGEKLQAVCDIDLDNEVTVDWLDEAEGADLPRGFGKD